MRFGMEGPFGFEAGGTDGAEERGHPVKDLAGEAEDSGEAAGVVNGRASGGGDAGLSGVVLFAKQHPEGGVTRVEVGLDLFERGLDTAAAAGFHARGIFLRAERGGKRVGVKEQTSFAKAGGYGFGGFRPRRMSVLDGEKIPEAGAEANGFGGEAITGGASRGGEQGSMEYGKSGGGVRQQQAAARQGRREAALSGLLAGGGHGDGARAGQATKGAGQGVEFGGGQQVREGRDGGGFTGFEVNGQFKVRQPLNDGWLRQGTAVGVSSGEIKGEQPVAPAARFGCGGFGGEGEAGSFGRR